MGSAVFLFAVVSLFVIGVTIFVIRMLVSTVRSMSAPTVGKSAYVIDRRVAKYTSTYDSGGSPIKPTKTFQCYVTFNAYEGVTKEFAVDAETYSRLKPGDKGTLVTKGDFFIQFDR